MLNSMIFVNNNFWQIESLNVDAGDRFTILSLVQQEEPMKRSRTLVAQNWCNRPSSFWFVGLHATFLKVNMYTCHGVSQRSCTQHIFATVNTTAMTKRLQNGQSHSKNSASAPEFTTNSRQKPAQNSSHRLPHLVGSVSTTPPSTQPPPTSLVAIVHSVFSTFSLFNFVLDGHNLEKNLSFIFSCHATQCRHGHVEVRLFVHHPLSRPTRKSTRGRCDVHTKL